jgi:hypothetical protein
VEERLKCGVVADSGASDSWSTAPASADSVTKHGEEQPIIDRQVVRQSESCSGLAGVSDSGQSAWVVSSIECVDPDIADGATLLSTVALSHADAGGAATARIRVMAARSEVSRRIIRSLLVQTRWLRIGRSVFSSLWNDLECRSSVGGTPPKGQAIPYKAAHRTNQGTMAIQIMEQASPDNISSPRFQRPGSPERR